MAPHAVLSELHDAIDEDTTLRPLSKKAYHSRLNQLEKSNAFPIKKDETVEDLIDSLNKNSNLSTEYAWAVFLQIAARMSQRFKKMIGGQETVDDLRILSEKIGDQRRKLQSTTRDDDLDWKDLLALKKKAESLPRQERLIYQLYVSPGLGKPHAVVRNDFSPVKIVDEEKEMTDDDMNYLMLGDDPFIRMNSYKSSSRYGSRDFKIDKLILDDVPKRNEFLFQDRGGEPMTENSMQKLIQRTFKNLTGEKGIGVTKLRRAYAKEISTLPDNERRRISHMMGHSTNTNRAYAQES